MPELRRVYWDACVFLSYINGSPPERLPHLDALLAKSGKEFQVVTSVLSVIEVAFGKAEQDGNALDPEIDKKITGLWTGSAVHLIEFFPLVAHEARELIRRALPKGVVPLKPMDAAHLAAARRLGVSEFHTYDDKLLKYPEDLGFPIREPVDMAPQLPFGPARSAESQEPVAASKAEAEPPPRDVPKEDPSAAPTDAEPADARATGAGEPVAPAPTTQPAAAASLPPEAPPPAPASN
jgi:predicted nucleic acid-binding protein